MEAFKVIFKGIEQTDKSVKINLSIERDILIQKNMGDKLRIIQSESLSIEYFTIFFVHP